MKKFRVEHNRPIKRIRQACEPCRRKKSRCSGQKPVCANCDRLGQQCVWPSESDISRKSVHGAQRPMDEDRLDRLESKMNRVLDSVSRYPASVDASCLSAVPASRLLPSLLTEASGSANTPRPSREMLPNSVVTTAINLYALYCHCQPLPLVQEDLFFDVENHSPELVLAVIALTARVSEDGSSHETSDQIIKEYSSSAQAIVTRRIAEGTTELSTLQALCLLSLVDLSSGLIHRARLHTDLAFSLCQSAGIVDVRGRLLHFNWPEKYRRCFWSLFLLERLVKPGSSNLQDAEKRPVPLYPTTNAMIPDSIAGPIVSGPHGIFIAQNSCGQTLDTGIMSYAIQLTDIFSKASSYAINCVENKNAPPWLAESEYTKLHSSMEEFESLCAPVHRFNHARFAERHLSELQSNREYWGPWILVQLAYHTIFCVLNHPFLLSERLRLYPNVIPQFFLQTSFELMQVHTDWVLYFVDMLRKKGFRVSDPFLGYCAIITATVCLAHTRAELSEVRKKARSGMSTALSFAQDLAQKWPHLSIMTDKLRRLQASAYMTTAPSHRELAASSISVDISLLIELMSYASASESGTSAGSFFGPSLQNCQPLATPVSTAPSSALAESPRSLEPEPDDSFSGVSTLNSHLNADLTQNSTTRAPILPTAPMNSTDGTVVSSYDFFSQEEVQDVGNWFNIASL